MIYELSEPKSYSPQVIVGEVGSIGDAAWRVSFVGKLRELESAAKECFDRAADACLNSIIYEPKKKKKEAKKSQDRRPGCLKKEVSI